MSLKGSKIRDADSAYMVRWRYDFADKPTRYGYWSRPGVGVEGSAWCANGPGLIRAAVEGKDANGGAIRTLHEVDGHDFCNFQWMAAALYGVGGGDQVCPSKLLGMKLVSRDFEYWVFSTGLVHKEPRTAEDKSFHYATYGR